MLARDFGKRVERNSIRTERKEPASQSTRGSWPLAASRLRVASGPKIQMMRRALVRMVVSGQFEVQRSVGDAFHEPDEFQVHSPVESGGAPPHSKTLARWSWGPEDPPGFGPLLRRFRFPPRFRAPMHGNKAEEAFHEP